MEAMTRSCSLLLAQQLRGKWVTSMCRRYHRLAKSGKNRLCRRVTAITPDGDGYCVALRDGPITAVSRRQAKAVRDLLAL